LPGRHAAFTGPQSVCDSKPPPTININNTDNNNKKNKSISPISPTPQNSVKKLKTSVVTQDSPSASQLLIINSTSSIETSCEMEKEHNIVEIFASSYRGPLHVIISSQSNNNIGNLHPFKLGKVSIKTFNGITNISPIGAHKIKITFNSLSNTNECLSSSWSPENDYVDSIPRSFIYSLGDILFDLCVSEDDFWDRWECCHKIVEFRRINI